MTISEYILAGVAIGLIQAVTALIAWRRGYDAAMRDVTTAKVERLVEGPRT